MERRIGNVGTDQLRGLRFGKVTRCLKASCIFQMLLSADHEAAMGIDTGLDVLIRFGLDRLELELCTFQGSA